MTIMSIKQPNRNLVEAAQKYFVDDEEFKLFATEVERVYSGTLDLERGEAVPFDTLKQALCQNSQADLNHAVLLMKAVQLGWIESDDCSNPMKREVWLSPYEPDRSWTDIKNNEEPSDNYERASWALEQLSENLDVVGVTESEAIFAYHDGVWDDDGEQVLRDCLTSYMGKGYSTGVKNEAQEYVLGHWAISRDELGVSGGKLPLENGILDLDTRELNPIHPTDYITQRMPVEYDEEADCPAFRDNLETVVPDNTKQQKLQEFLGYCLQPNVSQKEALILLGETNTGKSTFLRAVEQIFRDEDIANVPPGDLQTNRHAAANLEHKMVNIVDELDDNQMKSTDEIKKAISGDPMQAEPKYKQAHRFEPSCKHIFASNKSLRVSVTEQAFWDRWLTVVFEKQVPKEDKIPQDDMVAQFEKEASGILNWALEGLDRLRNQAGFTDKRGPGETHQVWTEFGDTVSEFIDATIIRNQDQAVFASDLHESYQEFCRITDQEANLSQYQLTQELKERGIGSHTTKYDPERGNTYTCFEDIALRDLDQDRILSDPEI